MRLGRVEATGGFFLMLAWLNYLDRSFIVPMATAACVAHELGHFFMIQLLKGEVKSIRLTAVGAEMVLGQPLGYWQEGLSALAGPGANLLLGGFNLLPVPALDGGRALHLTVSWLADPLTADRLCRTVGLMCALLLTGAALALMVFCHGGLFLLLGAAGTLIPQLPSPGHAPRRMPRKI